MRQHLTAVLSFSLLLLAAGRAPADEPRACGTADGTVREPNATDALFVLRGAVEMPGTCGRCLCDVDSNGSVTALDALTALRRSVELAGPLHCPACACTALVRLETGLRPSAVVTADIDGDGYGDLVTADLEGDEVSIFHGRGRGVFEERRAVAVGDTPQSATVADLDGDGHEDIVVSEALPNGLTILFGSANGEFENISFAAGEAPINSVAVDLDGDDHLDLVVANSLSNDVSIFLGNGDRTFAPEVRYTVGTGPRWVGVGDMDHDDVFDLVTANRDSQDLSILYGAGDGTFGNEMRLTGVTAPSHVTLADLDGDNRTDIVVGVDVDDAVGVFLAKGDHGFDDVVLYPALGNTIQTDVALIDDDDVPDIVAFNYGVSTHGVTVFFGAGDGTFGEPRIERTGAKTRSGFAADVDGDSTVDIVAANSGSDDLTILHGRGDGTFVGRVESNAPGNPGDLLIHDLDADGFDDIVTIQGSAVVTHLSDGEDRFVTAAAVETSTDLYNVFFGEIDGDDVADLVGTADEDDGQESDQKSVAFIGNGEGSFELSPGSSHLVRLEPLRQSTAAGDIDGDGVTDLAIAGGNIAIFRGNPDGTFNSFGSIVAARTYPALEIADIDGDGDNDILELDVGLKELRVHRNKGGGDFAAPKTYGVTADHHIATNDIDGDGDLDVVTISGDIVGTISTLLNNGRGVFGSEATSSVGAWVLRSTLADFDGDGATDLAALLYDNRLLLLPGDAKGHFGESRSASTVTFRPEAAPRELGSGSFDSSGRPDLVLSAREPDRHLTVLAEIGECMLH